MNECRDLKQKTIYNRIKRWHFRPQNAAKEQKIGTGMWRLIKVLLFLILLAGATLVAYAYVGPVFFPAEFAAPTKEVTRPVTLETN